MHIDAVDICIIGGYCRSVLGARFSTTWWHWLGTAVMISVSFYLIIKACERLPSGTVYAVFTGMGAGAIVMIDFTIGSGQFTWAKGMLIGLIITGVIGIKLTTTEPGEDGQGNKDHRTVSS